MRFLLSFQVFWWLKQILTKAMVQKLKTQNDMILLITLVFPGKWQPWKCQVLAPACTTALLQTTFHQRPSVLRGCCDEQPFCSWLGCVLKFECQRHHRGHHLYIWGTQMDSTGSCPLTAGGHCISWSLVFHFTFPIWSNAYISYNLIHFLIILIYRIKIQNFLSSDHSNIPHTGKNSWKYWQAQTPTHKYTTGC